MFGLTVTLTPSLPSPQPLNTAVTFTATVTGSATNLNYQFSVAYNGAQVQVAQDFSASPTFTYAPFLAEGPYTVDVVVRSATSGNGGSASTTYTYSSRVTGSTPVVSTTIHPLVALFSAPACPTGSSMYVVFGATGINSNLTNTLNCNGTNSMNFYVAGMRANTAYSMVPVTVTNGVAKSGTALSFTTGSIGPKLQFPTYSTVQATNSQSDQGQGVLLLDYLGNGVDNYFPTAYDLSGNIVWYLPELAAPSQNGTFFIRPLPGGGVIVYMDDPNSVGRTGQILRIYDLAGNVVRQTSVANINRELNKLGKLGINDFDHDATILPNGHLLAIAAQEEIFPAGTQGSAAPIDILGDAIIDLDTNLQLSWSWSGYDNLDINRAAILGETCTNNQAGCPPVLLASIANDWLHANSLNYIPSSGDVLLSMRHQDWVAKIDYKNGAGTGAVLWELGLDGNWTINSSDPYPWFSHQHDVEYELGGTTLLSLYDNGNTRITENPGEFSRGMALQMDESTLTCTPLLYANIGYYSVAVGSAQRLNNGNYYYESGFVPGPATAGYSMEFLPSGALNWETTYNTATYRGYRMLSLYQLGGNR